MALTQNAAALTNGQVSEKTNSVDGSSFLLSSRPHSKVAIFQVRDPNLAQWGTTFDVKIASKDSEIKFSSACVDIETSDISTIYMTKIGWLSFAGPLKSLGGWPVGISHVALGAASVTELIGKANDNMQTMALMVGALGAMSSSVALAHPNALTPSTVALNNASVAMTAMAADQLSADSAAGMEVVDARFWPNRYGGPGQCLPGPDDTYETASRENPSFLIAPNQQVGGLILTNPYKPINERYWLITVRLEPKPTDGRLSGEETHSFVFERQ